jgi:hypothetical protein
MQEMVMVQVAGLCAPEDCEDLTEATSRGEMGVWKMEKEKEPKVTIIGLRFGLEKRVAGVRKSGDSRNCFDVVGGDSHRHGFNCNCGEEINHAGLRKCADQYRHSHSSIRCHAPKASQCKAIIQKTY